MQNGVISLLHFVQLWSLCSNTAIFTPEIYPQLPLLKCLLAKGFKNSYAETLVTQGFQRSCLQPGRKYFFAEMFKILARPALQQNFYVFYVSEKNFVGLQNRLYLLHLKKLSL